MFRVIIADTSCLIILCNIELLNILHDLLDEIIITPQVREEFSD
jgi:predicted nucleic acid-binding protein